MARRSPCCRLNLPLGRLAWCLCLLTSLHNIPLVGLRLVFHCCVSRTLSRPWRRAASLVSINCAPYHVRSVLVIKLSTAVVRITVRLPSGCIHVRIDDATGRHGVDWFP